MSSEKIIVDKSTRQINLINATAIFLLSFLLLYLINLFVAFGFAEYFGIDSKINYYGIEYLISNQSSKWTVDSLIIMFLAGPFASLLVAGLFARLHRVFRADKGHLKLFFLFMYLHGMNFCFGSILAGAVTHKMTWFAMAWMGLPQIMMYLLGIIGIVMIFITGSAKSVFFLESCNYPNPNNLTNRQFWLLNTVLKPWFLGTIILVLLFLPEIQIYFIVIMATFLIAIVPIFRGSTNISEVMVFDANTKHKVFWKVWITFIVIALLFRFIFA